MQAREEALTDVPTELLDKVVASFARDGARVERHRQPDGNWTVVATFDPENDVRQKRRRGAFKGASKS